MQMGAETAACVAAQRYRFANFDILIGFHENLRQMTVDRFQTVGVTQNHIMAITLTLEIGKAHATVKRCIDSIADLQFEVDTLMLAAEARAVAIRRSDITRTRHCKLADVDHLAVGHRQTGIGVDTARIPPLGVDIKFRLLLIFEKVVKKILCIFY